MAEQAVLALGAWLKNTACLLPLQPGAAPRWSVLHGDLGDPQACAALQDSVAALQAGGGRIAAVAHDLHPDFFSTRLAQQLAADLGVPAIGVQHHQAHIAAVLAEHADSGDQPVIGLALDGFGLGPAGEAWGGELLWLQGARWQRLGGLWPLALPGGDAAAREPWRMAAAALHTLGRGDQIVPRLGPSAGALKAGGVAQMLRQGLNCPPTSSTGRWFDAAAGALGLSVRQAHEAEAAIALERAAQRALAKRPAHVLAPPPGVVDLATTTGPLDIRALLQPLLDLPAGADATAVDDAAAGFHLGLADALAGWAAHAAARHGTRRVVLGGGCFANQVLTTRLQQQLHQRGLQVLRPMTLSCGDAGLALGQAWVAAQQSREARHQAQPIPEATCA